MSQQKNRFPRIDKSLMKENVNISKSKLASRLFRNSSLNHINPNVSMLSSFGAEPSILNTSSSNSQLIAGISLRKLKNKPDQEPYLSINNGKLLINKFQSSFNETSPTETKKQMFKKLEKLSNQPFNKILPDDLIDFPIEKQEVDEPRIEKKVGSPKLKKKKSRQIDGKSDLLPDDFIQMLEEDKNIKNEFCYLKKMDHPYDLKIIQFDKNLQKKPDSQFVEYPSSYITISSRGVTYFSQDQSRFVTLQEWKKQANYFKKIIKLDFFKNFKIIKNFSNWKKYLRKSAMKSTIQKLRQRLVYNDLFLSSSLLEIRKICYKIETDVSYCHFDNFEKNSNIKQFRAYHEAFLDKQFKNQVGNLEEQIKRVLIKNMSLSMKEFKEENKISSSIEGKGMPLLIGDQKNLEMPYTKEATLRTQQEKFQKFVKLVDLIITHSKANMMSESTNLLARKLEEENYFYEKTAVLSNYKTQYKSLKYLQCVLTLDPRQKQLFLKPTKEDLRSLFEDIVSRSVVRICRHHRKISSDIDVLSIIYDNQDQFPKDTESENLKAIMTSDNRQDNMLNTIMAPVSASYNFILKYIHRFKNQAKQHFENLDKLEQIQSFEPRDHELIKNYLLEWQKQKQFASSQISNEHEGPLFELSLKEFKQEIGKSTENCIKKLKTVIPKILEVSSAELYEKMFEALQQIKSKPSGIEGLIKLDQYIENIDNDIQDYKTQRAEIECLERLMSGFSSSQSSYKKPKSRLQQLLAQLKGDVPIAKKTVEVYKTNAKTQVEQMKKNFKLAELYAEIIQTGSDRQNPKTTKEMVDFINKKRNQLTKIIEEFKKIVTYEKFLNLGQSDSLEINLFQQFFSVYQKIWVTLYEYECFFAELEEKYCSTVSIPEALSKTQEFINIISTLQKDIKQNKQKDVKFQFSDRDLSSLNLAFEQTEKEIKPLIDTIECLNDTVLGQKQWKEVRGLLTNKNKKILRILQMDRNSRTVKDLIAVSAASQLPFFRYIASKAKKNSEINKKLEIVRSFTNFSKNHLNIFKNLTEKFKVYSPDFLQQVDQKLMMINFVLQQSQNKDYEKAKQEKNTLEKLREILTLWTQYEEHVEYFEPIYTLTDWKNTAEAKLFIAATEQNWKKTSKNYKDASLIKILSAERIIPSLKQSIEILESLYPGCRGYFNSKRLQNLRLYFLPDCEIIKIHSESKDIKGFNNYVNKCFPAIKELRINEDSISQEIISLDGEVLPVKLKTSTFEVEQMLKIVDEGIKISVKANLRSCWTAYSLEEFNKSMWIKDHLLQSLIFMTNVYFTQIIEQDYLCADGDDLEKLYTYHMSQIESLKVMITESKEIQFNRKLLVLLTQALGIRDTIMYLISENVSSKESYPWVRQTRSYYSKQQSYNEYLVASVSYDHQFVCMESNPLLLTSFNDKIIISLVNSIFCCNNVPIVSKSLLYELSLFNAKSYNYAALASGSEISVLQNIVQGTWLTGSFTDIVLPREVSIEQLRIFAKTFQQIQLAISLKEPYLRGFKNLPLSKQAGICLISPSLMRSPNQLKSCKFDYRIINYQEVPWSIYFDLLFEIYAISKPNLSKKIPGILSYLQKSLPNISFSRLQLKAFVEQVAQDNLNQNAMIRFLLKKITKKDLSQAQKKFVSKVFQEVFGVHNNEKLTSYKSIREINIGEQEISKISMILRDNKVCLLVGQNSQFKELIAYGAQRYFKDQKKPKFIACEQQSLTQVLGYFNNGKWIEGTLQARLKQCCSQTDCILLIGKCTKSIISVLEKLNSTDESRNYVNLENNQTMKLGVQQKIIFLSDNQSNDPIFQKCGLKIYDVDQAKSLQEIFDYLTRKKPHNFSGLTLENRYFANKTESLISMQNVYLNNLEKTGNSNMKMLGYKSEYNETAFIMNRFVSIVHSALMKDKDKACVNNPKMIEKMYVWAMYWSICSSLPKRNVQRLDKLFESIKIQFDKSQSLSETEFSVSERNLSVSKFIKSTQIYQNKSNNYFVLSPQLLAKKELIKLLVAENNHIMLVGGRYSGKSSYLQYLENEFLDESYSVAKVSLTKNTTKQQFFEWLKPKIFIQCIPNNKSEMYTMCSKTGKKLVILIDNFNLINTTSSLFGFFQTATTHQYYYDTSRNCTITIGDVCFICSKTDSFQCINSNHGFMLRQFFPIYVNEPELSDIMTAYSKSMTRQEGQIKQEIIEKILSSIVSLHTFAINLLASEKQEQKQFLSYDIPIWIAQEILYQIESSNSGVNQLIGLWKFLTAKKYIDSGILQGYRYEIEHEHLNLISLIIKKPIENDILLKCEAQLVQQLHKARPILRITSDNSEYYQYLAYLLRSPQFKHIISHSNTVPISIKAEAVQFICKSLQIKYQYAQSVDEINKLLKTNENCVIYVNTNNLAVVQMALAAIVGQDSDSTFIIDFNTKDEFENYLRFQPSIRNLAHIYAATPKQNPLVQHIQHYYLISNLLKNSQLSPQDYVQLLVAIQDNLNSDDLIFERVLQKRTKQLSRSVNNIKSLQETYEECKNQTAQFQNQIQKLDSQLQELQANKSKLLDSLEQVKKSKTAEKNEKKQTLNKSIGVIEAEVKKVKMSKKELNQNLVKIRESSKQKLQIFSFIDKFKLQTKCIREYEICTELKNLEKFCAFKIIHTILKLYFNFKNPKLAHIIETLDPYCMVNFKGHLSEVYSTLFGISISDIIHSEYLVKWCLSDFKLAFVTPSPDQLIEKLQAAQPQVRQCTSTYDLTQNIYLKPIITKDRQFLNAPKTSVICKSSEGLKEFLPFQLTHAQKKREFLIKIQKEILKRTGQTLGSEIEILEVEKKRFIQESGIAKAKLIDKISTEKTQFFGSASFSQIKQIGEAVSAIDERIRESLKKIEQIKQTIKQKYGKLLQNIAAMKEYLDEISKRHPYTNLTDKYLIDIIVGSLIFREENENDEKQGRPVAQSKELLVEQVINKIERKICQWICISLSPIDAIEAYFFFACLTLQSQGIINLVEYESVKKLLCKQSKDALINSHQDLSQVITKIKQNSQSKLDQMLEFSQKILHMQFRSLLDQKEDWLEVISSVFRPASGENEMGRIFMVVGSLDFNVYKIINKTVRKLITNQQNLLFLAETEQLEHRIELLEKTPASQQGWIVLEGWTSCEKISRIIDYISKSKNYRAIFLFENKTKLAQIKPKLPHNDYHQTCLSDKTNNVCYKILKILKKHELPNAGPEQNKLLKMMSADHVSRLLKGLVDPISKFTSFSYRLFELLTKKIPKLSCSDIVLFALDFFYTSNDPKDRAFLKEARKLFKAEVIPQIFEDNNFCEHYALFSEGFEQLKVKVDKQSSLKNFIKLFLPEFINTQITTDSLFGFEPETEQKQKPEKKQYLDSSKTLKKLNMIIQKAPILSKQEESEKIVSYFIELLKEDKRNLEFNYTKKIEKIKRLSKILESKRYITNQTESEIIELENQGPRLLQTLLQIYGKINSLQKQIQSREHISLAHCIELTSQPKEFLYAYVLELQNLSKVDWGHFSLNLKCLTDKQKELHKEAIERNEYLSLPHLKINNAKFQLHKNFLESIAPSESSKITNVVVYIGKEDTPPYVRHIPLIVHDCQAAQLAVTSKVKQIGIWGPEVFISFFENESAEKQQPKKK